MTNMLLPSKTARSWLLIWLCLSLLLSALLVLVAGVNLQLSKRGNNLQSGELISRLNGQSSNLEGFWLGFSLTRASAAKSSLETSIQYPEVYELSITRLQILTPFAQLLFDIPLHQKTQLIELLKVERNQALPVRLTLSSTPPPLPTKPYQFAGLKITVVFAGLAVVFAALWLIQQAYLNYIQQSGAPADTKVLLSLILICGLWSLFRGQDFNWDLQNYHFYNPFAFIHNRYSSDVDPVGVHSYFSPLLDVPTYLILNYFPPRLASFTLGSFSGLFAFGVYKILALVYASDPLLSQLKIRQPRLHHASILVSLICAISGFASATQIGTTMNENFIAIPLVWSYYYLIRYFLADRPFWLYLAGLLIGIAVALKLTAITFALAFVVSYLLLDLTRIVSRRSLGLILAILGGFFMLNGIWMWKMWQVFHNPFFPNLGILHQYTAVNFLRDTSFLPQDLSHWLLMPFYLLVPSHLTSEQNVADPRLALFFCLLVVCAGACRRLFSNKVLQLLFINCCLAYVLWLLLFSIQRYTIAIEALASILIFVMLNYLGQGKRYLEQVILLTALLILAFTRWGNFNHLAYSQKFTDLGIPASQLPHDALVIFGAYPLAYLAPLLGPSNHYINRPNATSSEYNYARKQQLMAKFITQQRPIYLIDKTPEELRANAQSWLGLYQLRIANCLSFANSSRQLLCQLKSQ